MDSMRSLNSSLPSSRPNRTAPPEELLQAFRTAALSVTNLYKSAATNQANARQAGYQDALEDLLKFLDKENLGLQDGEGWKVREWATARYDGAISPQDEDEADEERPEVETRSREISQEGEDNVVTQNQVEASISVPRQESEEESETVERPIMFRFDANGQQETRMQTDEPSSPRIVEEPSSSSTNAPIRVEILNRNNRPISRAHNSRHNTRSNPRDFTFAAGSKRKLQFPDFFDISNINDGRDGFGGGNGPKKGRFV